MKENNDFLSWQLSPMSLSWLCVILVCCSEEVRKRVVFTDIKEPISHVAMSLGITNSEFIPAQSFAKSLLCFWRISFSSSTFRGLFLGSFQFSACTKSLNMGEKLSCRLCQEWKRLFGFNETLYKSLSKTLLSQCLHWVKPVMLLYLKSLFCLQEFSENNMQPKLHT